MTKQDTMSKQTSMSKHYKVIFNNKEIFVEAKNKTKNKVLNHLVKSTNKNKIVMSIIANDVLDCLNKAKELFFKQFNEYAKSIEVVRNVKTSTKMIVNQYDQKVSA